MQAVYDADPQKIIIGMVGLPARGKSYISKKIQRFMKWLGFEAKVFNIGNYRRAYMEEHSIEFQEDYFDNSHPEFKHQRQEIAKMAMRDLVEYIRGTGQIAILDGTNSNIERRRSFRDLLAVELKEVNYDLIWVESICNDPRVIEKNIRNVKVFSPDYVNKPNEDVLNDFMKRIDLYQSSYEPIRKEEGLKYVKTINIGREIFEIRGYIQQKICTFVMNINICPERIIYLLRHGETLYNTDGRIGGNPGLNENGKVFSKMLNQFFKEQNLPHAEKTIVLSSTMKRAVATAEEIRINEQKVIQLKVLDELNAGLCENMSYSQIQEKYPILSKERKHDKLRFRYPSGESYLDLISRLQPLVNWIQRQDVPIIVVAHQAVLRCLYAYFFKTQVCELPYLSIDLHVIIKLIPETYFFNQTLYELDTSLQIVANTIEKKKESGFENLPKEKKVRKIKSEFIGFKSQKE